MKSISILRHIIGYVLGTGIFVLGIPFGLYLTSHKLDHFSRIQILPEGNIRLSLSLLVGGTGIAFMLWSNLCLFFIGKGGPADGFDMAISPRTRILVTIGPYRYTRNPMAFGALTLYLGLALLFDSVICLGLVAALFMIVPVYIRLVEEPRLLRDFGDTYERYRRATSMLLPLPPRKKA